MSSLFSKMSSTTSKISSIVCTNISNQLRPIVFVGPSASGKTTLLKRLKAKYPYTFTIIVPYTTRKIRIGEIDGQDYHFVSREEICEAIDNSELLEHASGSRHEYSGNIYGTSKQDVQTELSQGRICGFVVDIEGLSNLKKTDLNPIYCFIKTPSLEVLEERLRKRNTETPESFAQRIVIAKTELEFERVENFFDHVIVNDNLDTAYSKLKEIFLSQIDQEKQKQ